MVMRKSLKVSFFAFVLAWGAPTVNAQGVKVTYLEEMTTSIQINTGNVVETQDNVSKTHMQLIATASESLYSPLKKEGNEQKDEPLSLNGNPGMTLIMMGNDVQVYKNVKDSIVLSEEYIIDRKFLIKENLIDFGWQLQNEEQIISGYKCHKAIAGQTVAWYCSDIPINDGPYIFRGLPGLILKLSHMNKTVTATEVLILKETPSISRPKGGKVVTREEFQRTMDKKLQEMGGQEGVNVSVEIK